MIKKTFYFTKSEADYDSVGIKTYKFLNNLKNFMIFWSKYSRKLHFLTLIPIFSKLNFSHIFGYSEPENGPNHPKIGICHPQSII